MRALWIDNEVRTCEWCEADISEKQATARYCSDRHQQSAYRSANPEKVRQWQLEGDRKRIRNNRDHYLTVGRPWTLKKKYGLTSEQYDEMLEAQGGVCAICGGECTSGRSLAVDHDHETGEVRGLLCSACNTGLGRFKDSAKNVRAALAYLEKAV